MTYVRTKLKLESMAEGEVLEVFLRGEDPVKSVPRSAAEEGHELLSLELAAADTWRLLLRKKRRL